ncbi:hypothetical protein KML002_49850 [Klebsiella quasipneumoniae subsp. similipneumoniae]|nr:hypothetical protein NUKP18_56350 [Klebsiella variicola]GKO88448.1 hypothetical protein NUBL21983_46080 [Klebsiella variicola]GLZ99707.1 hypothetical protein KML002_49850 [Klebsiella quasipneumoniae subsp. similipneumoniae]
MLWSPSLSVEFKNQISLIPELPITSILALPADLKGRGEGGRIYSQVTGYAGLSAPFDSTDTCSFIWRLHAANAASDAVVFNVCFVPGAEV